MNKVFKVMALGALGCVGSNALSMEGQGPDAPNNESSFSQAAVAAYLNPTFLRQIHCGVLQLDQDATEREVDQQYALFQRNGTVSDLIKNAYECLKDIFARDRKKALQEQKEKDCEVFGVGQDASEKDIAEHYQYLNWSNQMDAEKTSAYRRLMAFFEQQRNTELQALNERNRQVSRNALQAIPQATELVPVFQASTQVIVQNPDIVEVARRAYSDGRTTMVVRRRTNRLAATTTSVTNVAQSPRPDTHPNFDASNF